MEKNRRSLSHVQMTGMAMYDETEGKRFIQFEPAVTVPDMVKPMSGTGRFTLMSTGDFELLAIPAKKHAESKLLKKLPHGRLSLTKQDKIQLTLIFDGDETNIPLKIQQEALEAATWLQLQNLDL